MSILYSACIEKAACHKLLAPLCIHTRGLDHEHGEPSVLLTISFGNGQFVAHLSPDDADVLAVHLTNAARAAKSIEVTV